MSVYKGENVIAGASAIFVRKPAWSQAETIATLPFTAPKDGILLLKVGSGSGTGGRIFYVNGVEVAAFALGNGEQYDFSLQLNAGDILTSDFGIWGTYRFVPFEDSTIAEPEVVTPELIRNLHDPDWSQAIAVSAADLYAGYIAPKRGVFICTGVMPLANDTNIRMITVNNVPIVKGQYLHSGEYSYGNANCPVNAGDLIKSNISSAWGSETRYFVPYKAQ